MKICIISGWEELNGNKTPETIKYCINSHLNFSLKNNIEYLNLNNNFLSKYSSNIICNASSQLPRSHSDLARLYWMRDFLNSGYDFVMYIDADILLFPSFDPFISINKVIKEEKSFMIIQTIWSKNWLSEPSFSSSPTNGILGYSSIKEIDKMLNMMANNCDDHPNANGPRLLRSSYTSNDYSISGTTSFINESGLNYIYSFDNLLDGVNQWWGNYEKSISNFKQVRSIDMINASCRSQNYNKKLDAIMKVLVENFDSIFQFNFN